MYLSATTHTIVAVSDAVATTDDPQYVISYQDVTSSGMTMPMYSGQGDLNGTTDVSILAAPAASATRQIREFSICNIDTVDHVVTVYKDVSGTQYQLVSAQLHTGDVLVYNNNNSWSIFSSTGEVLFSITEITASGNYTKPAGLKALVVCAIGAGGGGGSGTRQAAGNNRFGGGGGGGGAIVWRVMSSSDIMATTAVTIGAGGGGGAGVLVDTTNGNAGSAGGDTSFGAILAKGGNGGGGGTTASGAAGVGGAQSACVPSYGPFALTGANGAGGATTFNSQGNPAFAPNGATGNNAGACASGGGGGGISNTNVSSTGIYTGGGVWNNGVLAAGGANATDGADNQGLSIFFSASIVGALGIGCGGGGGLPSNVDGGDGGDYGAGGGGGSGVLNGSTSGAGGAGGNGLVSILEIY